MHKVLLAFYKGTKRENPKSHFIDRTICRVTGSRFSHTELVYDYSPVTNIGLCWSSSHRDGGVRSTRIEFESTHWEIYEVATEKTEDDIHEFFSEHYGKKYDWFGAIGAGFHIFRQNPEYWFCSEIIAACLGLDKPHTYTPESLFKYYSPTQRQVL